jgi:signal transduction histidine kinase
MSSKATNPPRHTLGFRLAILYTLFLAASFGILFAISYQMVSHVVELRDREVIEAQVEKFSTLYLHGGTAALSNYFNQPVNQPEAVFVRIVDRLNHARFITVSHPVWDLLDQKMRQAGIQHADSRWDMLAREESEGSWLIGTQPLGGGYFLQVGRSNAASREVLAHMRKTGLKILLPALVISLFGGWFTSRSALSPLRALVDTTRHILETGDQKRRVPNQKQRGELSSLGTMFNEVLDQNEKLVESSRETLDNVAHDLRTPMTHLRNSAEHVLQNPDAQSLQMREALADCMEESEKILRMLNALMELAEAQTGAMHLVAETISLRELADETIELYSIVAEDRNIALKNDVPTYLTVEADHLRLRQCLTNLIDNALKYSEENSEVVLGGKSMQDTVELFVNDQGCGIDQEELGHIWDRLYRAERSRATPGLGLGLSMVKAIAKAHGGEVTVDSRPGAGSTFRIHLPRKKVEGNQKSLP